MSGWLTRASSFMNNIRNAGQRVIQAGERQQNFGAETAGVATRRRDRHDAGGRLSLPGTLNSHKAVVQPSAWTLLLRQLRQGRHLLADGRPGRVFCQLRRRQLGGHLLVHRPATSAQAASRAALLRARKCPGADPGRVSPGQELRGRGRGHAPARCPQRLSAASDLELRRGRLPVHRKRLLATASPRRKRERLSWHSLIAGARGIIYFQHSFSGPCVNHHVLRDNGCYQAMINTITSVDAQIKSIAPALNGPRLTSGFSASSNVRAVAKWDGQNLYVIAGSAENGGPFQSTFSIPCVGNATATVLGENRTIPVSAGSFSDSFADGNAVHIYRIDGGSTCGLN